MQEVPYEHEHNYENEYEYEYTSRLRSLLQIEHHLSHDFRSALNESSRHILQGSSSFSLIPHAALFLQSGLSDLADTLANGHGRDHDHDHDNVKDNDNGTNRHGEDVVRSFIQVIPDALLYRDEEDNLPIHYCVWENQLNKLFDKKKAPFIPLLAQEGISINLKNINNSISIMNINENTDTAGREETRGGLLLLLSKNKYGHSPLRNLCRARVHPNDVELYQTILEGLRQKQLFQPRDVQEEKLLLYCNLQFFDYFADMCPEALLRDVHENASTGTGMPLYHFLTGEVMATRSSARVYASIRASIKHYPHHLGFLYHETNMFHSVWQISCDWFGMDDTWKTVKDSIHEMGYDTVFVNRGDDDHDDDDDGYEDEDSDPFFSPLFIAAVSDTATDLNILHHILRKEPAQWIAYAY